MITCDEALELLSATLDGPLTAEEQAALDAHLAQCEECRALQADFAVMHAEMENWEEVPPPPDLTNRIMAEIHASKVTPLPRPKRWRGLAGIAAVCAIALLGAGPLRMWLSPDNLMESGAAPTSQNETFDAMSAALQGESADQALDSTLGAAPAAAPPVVSFPVAEYTAPITVEPYASDYLQKASNAPAQSVYGFTTNPESTTEQELTPQAVPTPQSITAPPATTAPQVNAADSGTGGVSTNITSASVPPIAPRMAATPTYCGSLTLPYGDAPDLSAYTLTVVDTEWYYILPAQDFFALAEKYQELETVLLVTEGTGFSADAIEGLVILTDVPAETP